MYYPGAYPGLQCGDIHFDYRSRTPQGSKVNYEPQCYAIVFRKPSLNDTVAASIYMITSMPCRAVRCMPSVAGCPGAQRGVPIDLARHKGRAHCGGTIISRGQR